MPKAEKSIYTLWNLLDSVHSAEALSPYAQLIYHRLTMICNRHRWIDGFPASNVELMAGAGISEATLRRGRSELVRRGLISYSPGNVKGAYGEYSIFSSVSGISQVPETEEKGIYKKPETVNKGIRQTPNKKIRVSDRYPKTRLGYQINSLNDISGIPQIPLTPGNPLPASNTEPLILSNTYKNTKENTIFPDAHASGANGNDFSAGRKKAKKSTSNPAHGAYSPMVDFWLKELHPDWNFSLVDGQKMKSIIKKIEHRVKSTGQKATPHEVVDIFKMVCNNLPAFYKPKPLQVIDSHFDTIADEIKNKLNGAEQKYTRPREYPGDSKYRRRN